MVCFLRGCLPQFLVRPFLNTLSQITIHLSFIMKFLLFRSTENECRSFLIKGHKIETKRIIRPMLYSSGPIRLTIFCALVIIFNKEPLNMKIYYKITAKKKTRFRNKNSDPLNLYPLRSVKHVLGFIFLKCVNLYKLLISSMDLLLSLAP